MIQGLDFGKKDSHPRMQVDRTIPPEAPDEHRLPVKPKKWTNCLCSQQTRASMRRGKARQLDLIFWGWGLVNAACAWPARLVREVGHLPQVIRMALKVSLRGRAQAFFLAWRR